MCTDLYFYYACGCQHSVKKSYITCEHEKFMQNLREFLPGAISGQLYKDNEKLCTEAHKVWSSRFKTYCSICTAEEDGVTVKIEAEDLAVFKNAGESPPGN